MLHFPFLKAIKAATLNHKTNLPIAIGTKCRWKRSQSSLNLRAGKALEPFIEYALDVYYNGVDQYGNHIEESSREESFERRWNRARAILLKSK